MRPTALLLAALVLLTPGQARTGAPGVTPGQPVPGADLQTISLRSGTPRPDALRQAVVHDARDVADALRAAGVPFLGRLVWVGAAGDGGRNYRFRQWVDDVLTDWGVEVRVDPETRRIDDLSGTLPRRLDLPPRPALSAEDAVAAALDHLDAGGERMQERPWIDDGVHEAMLLLHEGELWWGVAVELEWRPDPEFTHEYLRVDPGGAVEPWVDAVSVP